MSEANRNMKSETPTLQSQATQNLQEVSPGTEPLRAAPSVSVDCVKAYQPGAPAGLIQVNRLSAGGSVRGSQASSGNSMEQINLLAAQSSQVQPVGSNAANFGNKAKDAAVQQEARSHEVMRPAQPCATPESMASAPGKNPDTRLDQLGATAAQIQAAGALGAVQTDRKAPPQKHQVPTPVHSPDIASTDTRFLDNRGPPDLEPASLAREHQNWLRAGGPQLRIESKHKIEPADAHQGVSTTTPADVSHQSDGKLEPTTHISIFDKAHEASLHEPKPENSIFSLPNAGIRDSSRFKCLPVTDYGKIIAQQRQRQSRTAEPGAHRKKIRSHTGTVKSPSKHKAMQLGITSSDTQHTGDYQGKFSRTPASGGASRSHVTSSQTFAGKPSAAARRVLSKQKLYVEQVPVTERAQFGGGAPNSILTHVYSYRDARPGDVYGHTNSLGEWTACDQAGRADGHPSCTQCLQGAALNASRTGHNPYVKSQEKFLKRRGQSQSRGCAGSAKLVVGKNKHIAVQAKLLSLASDLKKNILPRQHEELTNMYKKRISKYLNLLAIHGDSNQQIVNNIFNTQTLDEDQLYGLLRANPIRGNQSRLDEQMAAYRMSPDHRQHYPQIVDTFSSMPSYYQRRDRKQAVQPTTFEMPTEEEYGEGDTAKAATFTASRARTFGACGGGGRAANAFAKTYNGALTSEYESAKRDAEQTLLQNVIKQIEERLQQKAAELDQVQKADGKADAKADDEEPASTQKNIVYRNRTRLHAVSANPVARILHKSGLGSPTLQKKKDGQDRRTALQIRREATSASRVPKAAPSQIQPSSTNKAAPPAPAAEQARPSAYSPAIQMVREMAMQSNEVRVKDRESLQVSPRKSLTMQRDYDDVGHSGETPSENHISTPNMFVLGPRGSNMHIVGREKQQLHIADEGETQAVKQKVYQILPAGLVANQDLSVLRPNSNVSEWATNEGGHSIFEMQPKNVDSEAGSNLDTNQPDVSGMKLSTQMNAPMTSPPDFVLSERPITTSYGSQAEHGVNSSGAKMVKTYEFHLPMHHIREEPGSPNTNPRYEMQQNKSQTSNAVQKPAKRKKLDMRRDDISSQMLEDGATNQDQNKSLKQFGGSCDDVSKLDLAHVSQATIGKRAVKQVLCRRSQQFHKSQASISANIKTTSRSPVAKKQHGTSHSIDGHRLVPMDISAKQSKQKVLSNLSMNVGQASEGQNNYPNSFPASWLQSPMTTKEYDAHTGQGPLADPLHHNSCNEQNEIDAEHGELLVGENVPSSSGRYPDTSNGATPLQDTSGLAYHSKLKATLDSNTITSQDPRSGPPEFLEIAQKNFELFSKKMAESGIMTTHSSVSQREEMMADMLKQSLPNSSQSVRDFNADHIEVINISQAVQTSLQRDANQSPRIQPMYVAAHTHIPYRKRAVEGDSQQSYAAIYVNAGGANSNTLKLMDVKNPYDRKQQLKPQNFKNKNLDKLAKKRSTTPVGNPQKQKQIYKGFTQKIEKKPKEQWYATQKAPVQQPSAADEFAPTRMARLAQDQNAFNQFKTFKANNELYIRIDDVVPALNIQMHDGSMEGRLESTETSMIAAFDRPKGMGRTGSAAGEYQTLENPQSVMKSHPNSPQPDTGEGLKQPEVLDFQVMHNKDMEDLVDQPVAEQRPQHATSPSHLDPEAPIVTARFEKEKDDANSNMLEEKGQMEITSEETSNQMNSQTTLSEMLKIQDQKLQAREAARSRQQLNSNGSLRSGGILPSNPSQPSYHQAGEHMKVQNMIGPTPPQKQQSANYIGSGAGTGLNQAAKLRLMKEGNSTLYNAGGQEYTDTRQTDERPTTEGNQFSLAQIRHPLNEEESPSHVPVDQSQESNMQLQRRVVLFDSQKESEPDNGGTARSPRAGVQQQALQKRGKKAKQRSPKRPSSKEKNPAGSKAKHLDSSKLATAGEMRTAMKKMVIDRQILSQAQISEVMHAMEVHEQRNQLAEHFETLRTYEFSPSLQAQGYISPKAEDAVDGAAGEQSVPLRFDEIQGNLQNYNWHLLGENSPPEEKQKRPRNKTADTADHAQSRHRSKLIKTAGAPFPKKNSLTGKSAVRPSSRDTTPTPLHADTPLMNKTSTEMQQLQQLQPTFTAVQSRNTGIRAHTSSVPQRAKLQYLQNKQRLGANQTQTLLNPRTAPNSRNAQWGQSKDRMLHLLSQKQAFASARFDGLELTGTRIASADGPEDIRSMDNQDVLQHIIGTKNAPVVVPRNMQTQAYQSVSPTAALGSNLGRGLAFIQYDQEAASSGAGSPKHSSNRRKNVDQNEVQGRHYLTNNPLQDPVFQLNLRTQGLNLHQMESVRLMVDKGSAPTATHVMQAIAPGGLVPTSLVSTDGARDQSSMGDQNDYRDQILDVASLPGTRLGKDPPKSSQGVHHFTALNVPKGPRDPANKQSTGQIVEMRLSEGGGHLVIGVMTEEESAMGTKNLSGGGKRGAESQQQLSDLSHTFQGAPLNYTPTRESQPSQGSVYKKDMDVSKD